MLFLAVVVWQRQLRLAAALRRLALLVAAAISVAGWVLWRQFQVYGDPLAAGAQAPELPVDARLSVLSVEFLERIWSDALPHLMLSFIGRLGWLNIELPAVVYLWYLGIGLLAAGGICLALRDSRLRDPQLLFALTTVAVCLGAILVYYASYGQRQGRYLFPVIGLLGCLATRGLLALGHALPARLRALAARGIIAASVAIGVTALITTCQFYYRLENYLAG